MEIPKQNIDGINYYGNIEITGGGGCMNQQNDLHVSVIKPITKKIIHYTDPKVTAFYKPTELVEEVTTYMSPGDSHLFKMYKDLKEKEKTNKQLSYEIEKKGTKLSNGKSIFNKLNFKNLLKKNDVYKRKNSLKKTPTLPPPLSPAKLFKENKSIIPKIETVFIPKFEKNVEIVSHLKENLNVDYTYMIPKPVVIPVEVPVLKFKDKFQIVPIRKKIIPVIKFTDETIYVDCYIEKPYLVTENIVVPTAFDVPIEMRTYLEKAPPIVLNKPTQSNNEPDEKSEQKSEQKSEKQE